MRTDTLFYELFQAAPQTFFELMGIAQPCPYRFESITVKTSEKRIDGVLEPQIEGETIYFLEVQASPDRSIYWRAMREVATYFEQRPQFERSPWQAIVLWLDGRDDPGFGTLATLATGSLPQLVSIDLESLFKRVDEDSLVFTMLHPLMLDKEEEVRQNIGRWVETIHSRADLAIEVEERLISVLSQFIEQKFKTLTYKELTAMLRLTPFRETESAKELLKEERVALLGEHIQARFGVSDEVIETICEELNKLDMHTLRVLFRQIARLSTLPEVEIWIADHIATIHLPNR